MNIYTHKVVCAICGGEGVATQRIAASEWTGAKLVHNDRSICLYYIEKKKKTETKRKQKLKSKQY